jgi:hypothetical protein
MQHINAKRFVVDTRCSFVSCSTYMLICTLRLFVTKYYALIFRCSYYVPLFKASKCGICYVTVEA